MNRGGPLRRRARLTADPAKTREWRRRSGRPLPARSPKAVARLPAEAAWRASVFARDGGCTFPHELVDVGPERLWRCQHAAGAFDAHHVVPRSVDATRRLDVDNGTTLCSLSHTWVTDHPAEARRLKLHGSGWDTTVAGRITL